MNVLVSEGPPGARGHCLLKSTLSSSFISSVNTSLMKWDLFLYSSACSLSLIPITLLFRLLPSLRSSHISPFSFLLLSFYSIDSYMLYSLALFTHLNLSLLNLLPPYLISSSFPSRQHAIITSQSLSFWNCGTIMWKKNPSWAKLYSD